MKDLNSEEFPSSEPELRRTEADSGSSPCVQDGCTSCAEGDTEGVEFVPRTKYEAALFHVYGDENLTLMLKITSYAAVIATLYAFFYHLISALPDKNYMYILELLSVTGVPFVIVSVMRRVINLPRPYECLPFYEQAPKCKRGQSFPSRHVFSIFVIASALIFENLSIGILLAAAGIVLAICRILLGYHFIRDCVAGAVIGIISGVLGRLLFMLF